MTKKIQVCILGDVSDFQGLSKWLLDKAVEVDHFKSEDDLLTFLASYCGECLTFVTPAFHKNNGKDIIVTASEKLLFRHSYHLYFNHKVSSEYKMLLLSLGYSFIAEGCDALEKLEITSVLPDHKKAS